jgi:hypothetical protein
MNAGSISVIIRVTAGAEIREDGVFDLRPVKSRRLRNIWNSEREIQTRRHMMTKQEIKSEVEKMIAAPVLLPGAEDGRRSVSEGFRNSRGEGCGRVPDQGDEGRRHIDRRPDRIRRI